MVDEYAIENSKQKENTYIMKRQELQAQIDQAAAEEQTKKIAEQEEPKSNNLFTTMRRAYEKRKAEADIKKATKQFIKKEYEDKEYHARRERAIQEKEKELQEKINRAGMTREEKAARIKGKITNFTQKVSAGLGAVQNFANSPGFTKRADRVFGNAPQQKTSGGLPAGDRIAQMMGGGMGGVSTKGRGSTNTQKYTTGNKAPDGNKVMSFLGKSNTNFNIGGYLPKKSPGGKKPAEGFGMGNRDYGNKLTTMLGGTAKTKPGKPGKKGKKPTNEQDKILQMLR